jgi:hypothetical protein
MHMRRYLRGSPGREKTSQAGPQEDQQSSWHQEMGISIMNNSLIKLLVSPFADAMMTASLPGVQSDCIPCYWICVAQGSIPAGATFIQKMYALTLDESIF